MSNQRPLPSVLAKTRVNGAIAAMLRSRFASCFCRVGEHLRQLGQRRLELRRGCRAPAR